jgi:hypothetical protein
MTDIRSAPDPLVALREALRKPLDEVMIVAAILRENPETHSFSARLDRAAVGFRAALDSIEEGSRGPSNAEVATRLRWLADRLEMVYGESPNVDYLLHTRSMAAALAAASPSREGAGLAEAIGRLLGVTGAIAEANADGNLDPKHPYFWPDLDAARAEVIARLTSEEQTDD